MSREEIAAPKRKRKIISEAEALKFTRMGCANISALDAEGRSLIWRSGDLRARLLLNDLATKVYVPHSHPECQAVAMLIHAERYLGDRLAYELHPWPKGMIKDESVNPLPDLCPLCARAIIEPDKCYQCGRNFCSMTCTLDHAHEEIANAK